MKLSNFENNINATILQRGKSYYEMELVETLEEISRDEWEAQVEGTELYTVDVALDGNTIVDHYCDCPYDGGTCKHEVAVFYALQAIKKTNHGKSPKRTPIKKKIELILGKISKDELKNYIQNTVLSNKKQRDHFLIHFDHLLGESADPEKYRQMVKGIINNYSGQYGFIDYRAASGVCNELSNLLDQAEAALKHSPELAFTICRVVIEALPDMAESMDDSGGESGSVLEEAVEIILAYLQLVDEDELEPAFQWCMQTYLNNNLSDYGYDDVDRLFDYFCTADSIYKDQLLNVIDKKIASTGEYGKEYLLSTKSDLYKMWGNQAASRKIIMDNLDEPRFRQILVNENLDANNPTEAIKLIKQGIKVAERKGHPGTVSDWQKKLLDIAKQQNNREEIAHWTKILLFNRFSLDYYRLYKQSSKDWDKDYQELLKKMNGYSDYVAQIYAEENDHHSLFTLIKGEIERPIGYGRSFSRLGLLRKFMGKLIPHYPDEILDLYSHDIYQQAKTTGRSVYNGIANDLKDMKKLAGGKERVKTIISDFQQKYKNRPAMQEILGRL